MLSKTTAQTFPLSFLALPSSSVSVSLINIEERQEEAGEVYQVNAEQAQQI